MKIAHTRIVLTVSEVGSVSAITFTQTMKGIIPFIAGKAHLIACAGFTRPVDFTLFEMVQPLRSNVKVRRLSVYAEKIELDSADSLKAFIRNARLEGWT